MRHVPARVSSLQGVDHAGDVADVAGIIKSEQVAVVVEGELLRVAQAITVNFEVGSVVVTAENRTAPGAGESFAFLGGEMVTAVPNGEIEPAVGSANDAVQVVPDKRNPNTESVSDGLVRISYAIIIFVLHFPQAGNAGEIDRAVIRQQRKADAVEFAFEVIREQGAMISSAIAVFIFQSNDPVCDGFEPALGEVLPVLIIQLGAVFYSH